MRVFKIEDGIMSLLFSALAYAAFSALFSLKLFMGHKTFTFTLLL